MEEKGHGGFELVLPFLTDNPQWCYGFEAGKLYAEMQQGVRKIEGTYHRANDEQLFMMAQRNGYSIDWERLDDTWMRATFMKEGAR